MVVGTVCDMDHREILDVRERANVDVIGLGPHDDLGPHRDSLVQADIAIQFGAIGLPDRTFASRYVTSLHYPSLLGFAGPA
jgi:hypothetical protein